MSAHELLSDSMVATAERPAASGLVHDIERVLDDVALIATDSAGEVCFVSKMAAELLASLDCHIDDLLYAGLPAPALDASSSAVELTASGERSFVVVRDRTGGTLRLWTRIVPRDDGAIIRFGIDDPMADGAGEQLLRYADDLARARAGERRAQRELETTLARLADVSAELERKSARTERSESHARRGEARLEGGARARDDGAPVAGADFHGIITGDARMLDLISVIRSVGPREATVLIHGESGVGKELVAQALHEESSRTARSFIAVNCATLVPTLAESQLFGHVKGAFTGAVRDHDGVFAQADGGTLFLDEVAELPLELQSKLLRVLQEGEVTPVGAVTSKRVDVRLVAASHRRLEDEVNAGRFRADLMYRLRVVPIEVPPLRARRDDIPLLVRHFIERLNERGPAHVASVSPAVVRALRDHGWPGNVRELYNALEHAFALVSDGRIELEHLPMSVRPKSAQPREEEAREERAPKQSEEEAIKQALLEAGGEVGEAAKKLGMSRTTFWRKRQRYGI